MRFLFRHLAQAGFGIDDRHAGPAGTPLQVAALPYAIAADGGLSILLVTSRRSGRWILPKGWPVRGLSLAEAAAKEAFEEAGVRGGTGAAIATVPPARNARGMEAPALLIHPLRVEVELPDWPERGQRRRRWLPAEAAVAELWSAPLAAVLRDFNPLETGDVAAPRNEHGHDPAGGSWPSA
jgi:8-oxo-dGTP pyrophosphatase MutT (NUDIX family)